MPGFTPNFAIEYPCAGEIINPTVFQTFADDVEAALSTVDALSAEALSRSRAAIRDAGTSCAAGATTTLAFDSTDFSSALITSGATGFTVNDPGIYMVDLGASSATTTTSVTSWATNIRVAGTIQIRRKMSLNPADANARSLNSSGLIQVTAGQLVDFQWQWTGAGINLVVTARATICKISDP